ncbi:phage virion morphogenesis protein [Paenirhodobacter sp.]|uniref:phage virion morphogenesis protein n=1 Tax=Paenirhodobacter sp. TaxID=1965326 RepID=UPI003B3DC05A
MRICSPNSAPSWRSRSRSTCAIWKSGEEKLLVDRRYIRTDGDTGLIVVFEVGRRWWEAVTACNPTKKNRQADLGLLALRRGGKLVWSKEYSRRGDPAAASGAYQEHHRSSDYRRASIIAVQHENFQMPGTFTIEVNDQEARAALAGIIRRMEERRGFYTSVAELLRSSAMTNFKRQAAPDGTPWKKLKAATIRRRTAMGQVPINPVLEYQIRIRPAGLHTMAADDDSARVGVMERIPYGAIHQFGGTIAIPARKGRV